MQARRYHGTPFAVFQSFWRHRQLIWQMTRRDVLGRYRASFLGVLWAFFNPLFMLAVYTVVFGLVFRARWGDRQIDDTTEFAMLLFCGLIVFTLFSECVNRAPILILMNANFVKKVVFPLEILPWTAVGAGLFHALISFSVLIGAHAALYETVPWTVVIAPLLVFPLVLLTLGACWLLASLGVFLRDIGELIGVVTLALLFLSPIFYPPEAIPEMFRPVLYANPLTFVIVQMRLVVLGGVLPDWNHLAIYALACWLFSWFGFLWFQGTRRGFADVI